MLHPQACSDGNDTNSDSRPAAGPDAPQTQVPRQGAAVARILYDADLGTAEFAVIRLLGDGPAAQTYLPAEQR